MNEVRPKLKLALFGMGIIGGGPLGQGIPVLTDLFGRLTKDFEITFYSFQVIDTEHVPSGINVKQPIAWRIPGRLKYLWVSIIFGLNHIFNPYDLIFAISVYPTGWWAIRLRKFFGCTVIVQLITLEAAALPDISFGNLTKPWLRKITKYVCEKADVLVTVAEYQKITAQQSLPTMRKIIVLPLRIDPAKFPYVKKIISTSVQFIHIAYYSPVKDQDTLFLAFSKIIKAINCHLTVIGDGYNVPKVHKLVHELGLGEKITFTGVVMQSELPRYFHKAHILVHTSRFETGCAVIQEAMASGVAVCGTNVGILADIGDRYAVIVPPRDPELLADSILKLVNDPQRYEKMTAEAYQWITKYDAEWAAKNYKTLIEETIR